jgi:hypothetical protein
MHEPSQESRPLLLREDLESTPVFPIIHMIRTVCQLICYIWALNGLVYPKDVTVRPYLSSPHAFADLRSS